MKKYLVFVLTALAVWLTACDNGCMLEGDPEGDGNEPIVLKYEPVGLVDKIEIADVIDEIYPNYEIAEVAFVARFHTKGDDMLPTTDPDGNDTRIMLKAEFKDGTAELVLPQDPPEELLRSIASDIPAGFVISDEDAKTVSFVEIACNMPDDTRVFEFLYMGYWAPENINHELKYIYSDRDVTVTGEGRDWWSAPTTYDLNLQKGWNMVIHKTFYENEVQTKTVTHLMPEGMEWRRSMWMGGRWW